MRIGSMVPALLVATSSVAGAATFEILGPLPGLVAPVFPTLVSEAGNVSSDGAVAAGNGTVGDSSRLDRVPFRFQEGALDDLAGRLASFEIPHVTADGSKLLIPDDRRWWVWEGALLEEHALPLGVGPLSNIADSTPDGAIFVGQSIFAGMGFHAYRYADGDFSMLTDPDGVHVLFGADAVSADGSIVAGFTEANDAFRLNLAGPELTLLPALPGASLSFPSAMTPDGAVIVGAALIGGIVEAFRYENGQTLGLGFLAGSFPPWSAAFDVSDDGDVIVGSTAVFLIGGEAIVWDPANGWRALAPLLEAEGLDLGAWRLLGATSVSADGRVILGNAINDEGRQFAFRARLGPIPAEVDVRPGNPANPVRPGSRGLIRVALLSSWEFDATAIDLATLDCGGAGVAVSGQQYQAAVRDVDRDGRDDHVVKIRSADLDPAALAEGMLRCTGVTDAGASFQGSDPFRLVGGDVNQPG